MRERERDVFFPFIKLNFSEPNWLKPHETYMIPQCWCISHSAWDLFNRSEYFLNILPFYIFFAFAFALSIFQEQLRVRNKSQKKMACTWNEIVKCGVWVSVFAFMFVCIEKPLEFEWIEHSFFLLLLIHILSVCLRTKYSYWNATSNFFSFVIFVFRSICLSLSLYWMRKLFAQHAILFYSITFYSLCWCISSGMKINTQWKTARWNGKITRLPSI